MLNVCLGEILNKFNENKFFKVKKDESLGGQDGLIQRQLPTLK